MKWIILLLILFTILCISTKNISELKCKNCENNENVSGKTIWLLWLQGWDNAPSFIQKIKDSWIHHNSEWNVELVSEENLSNYIDVFLPPDASPAAKSDIIRLNLLYTHGGVWADSTLVCMSSLDDWIYDVIQPIGFWMYHNGDEKPCSWFLISMKGNYMITKWKEACDEYWKSRTEADQYFWMDSLFMNILRTDETFRTMWSNVPYIDCEARGQPHMLAGKCNDDTPDLKHIIKNNPPYVIKLSRYNEPIENSNMAWAIEYSFKTKSLIHETRYKNISSPLKKDKVAVIADCGNESELKEIQEICDKNDIQMIIYDKCDFGKFCLPGVYCRPLKNVGRDAGTFIYFVITYYSQLPSDIYLLPASIEKHDRKSRFLHMIEDNDYVGYITDKMNEENFTIDEWDGDTLIHASIRPCKSWYEHFVGQWNSSEKTYLRNCTMHTTREHIMRHEKEYFLKLQSQLVQGRNLESVHFFERGMAVIF
jgi:hypothetical protein